ncbi:ependymin-2-like [Cheilinus undulatus]|uniref:ependymin-2-like n=1 Tax=Cheilinus undulatus TaxID=241271 RepID=UPI001BD4C9C1|nr:ependymin-2-like [Cheilinus undulatus]
MNAVSVLFCFSLLLAVGASQGTKPCVSPVLMSGGLTVMTMDTMVSTGTVSYDAIGQRMRIRTVGLTANMTLTDTLMLFNKKVYYEIDWTNFTCTKRPLNTDFIPMQVPPDAKLMGQVFMGSSSSWGMGVLTNTWYGTLPGNGYYSSVFTEIGCIPLTFSSYTPENGWITLSTFNWVLGNVDPMEYFPPFFCAKAQLEETEKPDSMFTVVKSLAQRSKMAE